jgi:hypothetical protein
VGSRGLDEPPPEASARAFIREKQADRPGSNDQHIRGSGRHEPVSIRDRAVVTVLPWPPAPHATFVSAADAGWYVPDTARNPIKMRLHEREIASIERLVELGERLRRAASIAEIFVAGDRVMRQTVVHLRILPSFTTRRPLPLNPAIGRLGWTSVRA